MWVRIKKRTLLLFAAFFLILPFFLSNNYAVYVVNRGFTNAIAVIGLVILYGIAGQISLGHVAFFAVSAYCSAICSATYNLPVFVSMMLGVLLSCVFGILLSFPAFKLSGPFLSICTVAFGEVVRQLIINLEGLTGGPYGFYNIPPVKIMGTVIRDEKIWYFILLVILVILASCAARIKNSYYGRALYAIQEDELVAKIMGINIRWMKRFAFINAAFFAGVAGALYAHFSGFLSQELVAADQSNLLFSMTVLGGTDSIIGALWSGVALTVAPEVMRFLQVYYIMILYLMVLLVVLVPWNKVWDKVKSKIGKEKAVI